MKYAFHMAFDPLKLVLEVSRDLFPKHGADIFFGLEGEKNKFGYTDFGQTPPVITVSVLTPLGVTPEILAHEVAHVVAGFESGHGKKWEKTFDMIHREYLKRLKVMAKKSHLKAVNPMKVSKK
jgi:hypothetical protein